MGTVSTYRCKSLHMFLRTCKKIKGFSVITLKEKYELCVPGLNFKFAHI